MCKLDELLAHRRIPGEIRHRRIDASIHEGDENEPSIDEVSQVIPVYFVDVIGFLKTRLHSTIIHYCGSKIGPLKINCLFLILRAHSFSSDSSKNKGKNKDLFFYF